MFLKRKTITLTVLATIFVILFACKKNTDGGIDLDPKLSKNHHTLLAVAYQQASAENRALQYQAFHLAKYILNDALKKKSKKKLAIVVDIDETVLDNSPYQANQVFNGESYPKGWNKWCNMSQARAIPGAVSFLKYAVSKNVDVFYVSNRKVKVLQATIKNLKKHGFPQVTNEHIYLRSKTGNKTPRRKKILKTHNIIILMGDNLGDFSDIFEKKSYKERMSLVDKNANKFGAKFIMLPNPMYGAWEGAVYEYKYGKSKSQKIKDLRNVLIKY